MPWEKQFDIDSALEKAGETFWSKGYEATSLRDLMSAMGIHKGSFYDTYGSKKELYLKALDRYIETRVAWFAERTTGLSPRASLEAHFNDILAECVSADGHRGCMVINCALELGHADPAVQKVVRRAFRNHEKFFLDSLAAAQEAGDVSSDIDTAATAKAMFAIVVGMRVQARAGAPKATLRTLADQALGLIGS